jgi:hypothetical protein
LRPLKLETTSRMPDLMLRPFGRLAVRTPSAVAAMAAEGEGTSEVAAAMAEPPLLHVVVAA